MLILRPDRKWTRFTRAEWLHACRQAGHGVQDASLQPLLNWLYQQFPQPGHPSHGAIPVILAPGKAIASHAHPEHTIVYYPFSSGCALMVEGVRVATRANRAIYLPPMTEHRVEKNQTKTDRISVALRWVEGPPDSGGDVH